MKHRERTNLRFCAGAEEIPTVPGAYLLSIDLAKPIRVVRATAAILKPGRYLYAGSAYGPGGLRARIFRHMRRAKSCRWHIDQITRVADVSGARILPHGNECDLVEQYPEMPVPTPHFGSSDCRHCRSHLLGPPAQREARFVQPPISRLSTDP